MSTNHKLVVDFWWFWSCSSLYFYCGSCVKCCLGCNQRSGICWPVKPEQSLLVALLWDVHLTTDVPVMWPRYYCRAADIIGWYKLRSCKSYLISSGISSMTSTSWVKSVVSRCTNFFFRAILSKKKNKRCLLGSLAAESNFTVSPKRYMVHMVHYMAKCCEACLGFFLKCYSFQGESCFFQNRFITRLDA